MQNISQQAIYGSINEERASRTERWKLILRKLVIRRQMRIDELSDMSANLGETRYVYNSRQYVAKQLITTLQNWEKAQ